MTWFRFDVLANLLEDLISNLKEKYQDVIDDIKKVIIFFKKEMAGGCDGEYNDCLWDCVADMVVRTRWGTGQCKDAAAMKKYLTLPRKAKVPVVMIPVIEKKMDITINVYERLDTRKAIWKALYQSPFDSGTGIVIDLRLKKEAYSLLSVEEIKQKDRTVEGSVRRAKWFPRGASLTPKIPLFYTRDEAEKEYPLTAYLPPNLKEARYKRLAFGDKDTKDTFAYHKALPRSSPFTLNYVDSVQ